MGDKTMSENYVRLYKNGDTGEVIRGELLGNGGTALSVKKIKDVIALVRRGYPIPFYEPRPGHVKIFRWPECNEFAYDDPHGWVEWPLLSLEILSDH